MNVSLKNPYIAVSDGRTISYGGNQMRSERKTEREVGCGTVAALDLILYLSRFHLKCADPGLRLPVPEHGPIPLPNYLALLHTMRKKYAPLIPGHGINGLSLAVGLNAYFLGHHVPYLAFWGVPYARLWSCIREMLEKDIPVILSVGPNFPLFWQRHQLKFYSRTANGSFLPGPQAHAHYVTVTAMDDEWLQIASWGRKYFIRKDEYWAYVKQYSTKLVSNILYIRKKGRGEA